MYTRLEPSRQFSVLARPRDRVAQIVSTDVSELDRQACCVGGRKAVWRLSRPWKSKARVASFLVVQQLGRFDSIGPPFRSTIARMPLLERPS